MHNNFTEEQIEQVLKEHPLLRYNSQKRMFFGKLVTDPTDEDYYEVEIHIDTFPQKFPIVREMEDRIPRKADRHMYSITGNCCFTTQAKEQILLLKEIFSLNTFNVV